MAAGAISGFECGRNTDRKRYLETGKTCCRQISQACRGPRVPALNAGELSAPDRRRDRSCTTITKLTLQGFVILCTLVRCTGGVLEWKEQAVARAFPCNALGVQALVVSTSLAIFQVADAATPLFSSFFPSESCCLKPNFLNENVAPELMRCKQECRAFVQYKTLQTCVLNETCSYAMSNFDTAIALARKRLKESFVCTADYRVCYPGVSCLGGTCADPPAILSIACELALRRAMCAYHFPRCITDKVIFAHEVCMEACDDVKAYCNITLGEVVAVDKCTRRNFGCTGAAHRPPSNLVLPLLLILASFFVMLPSMDSR